MESWLKIYRKFIDWEWYSDVGCRLVFIHLLLTVNWQDKKWQGKIIRAGETVTSLAALASEVGISIQKLRTVLKKLTASGEISVRADSRHTVITLNNFSKYQHTNNKADPQETQGFDGVSDCENNTQATNEQQTINKQSTTPKELKNDRNIELYNTDGGAYYNNINNIYSESVPPPAENEAGKVFSDYEQNIGVLSPMIIAILREKITAQGAELVSLAIEEAVKNGAKSIRYIEKILLAWEQDNIATVDAARLRIAERSRKVSDKDRLPGNIEKSTFRNYPEDGKMGETEKEMLRKMMESANCSQV